MCNIDSNGEYEVYGFVVNDDGNREYRMWLFCNGEIVSASLTDGFTEYLGTTPNQIYCVFSNYHDNYIKYITIGETEREYYETYLYVTLSDYKFMINNIDIKHYSPYIQFESDTDNDIYYTQIKFDYNDTNAIYTLYFHNGKYRYAYTNDELRYDADAALGHKRSLVIHPSLPYAVLIYPLQRESVCDPNTSAVAVISLRSGQILDKYSYNTVLDNLSEEANELLGKLDFEGFTVNYVDSMVLPTDSGFDIYWSIVDNNGNILVKPSLSGTFSE